MDAIIKRVYESDLYLTKNSVEYNSINKELREVMKENVFDIFMNDHDPNYLIIGEHEIYYRNFITYFKLMKDIYPPFDVSDEVEIKYISDLGEINVFKLYVNKKLIYILLREEWNPVSFAIVDIKDIE